MSDEPFDLSPLAADAAARAARVTAQVGQRIAAERDLWSGVRNRLARWAVPAALAAAAGLAGLLLTGKPAAAMPDRFVVAVMGRGPVIRWVGQNQRPELPELVAMLGGAR